MPLDPIIENPFGVHDHDVLSGRGAFVNGHIGNQRLRGLAIERKIQFDKGNYSEKRALATEIVGIIRSLDPPGRFLKRVTGGNVVPTKAADDTWVLPPRKLDGSWEELSDDKAIHKACQVMRDINRPDRAGDKRSGFKGAKAAQDAKEAELNGETEGVDASQADTEPNAVDGTAVVDDGTTLVDATAVEEAVAETLDKVLVDSVETTDPGVKVEQPSEEPATEVATI